MLSNIVNIYLFSYILFYIRPNFFIYKVDTLEIQDKHLVGHHKGSLTQYYLKKSILNIYMQEEHIDSYQATKYILALSKFEANSQDDLEVGDNWSHLVEGPTHY